MKATASLFLLVSLASLNGCSDSGREEPPEDQFLHGRIMGTTWSLHYSGGQVEGLAAEISDRLGELDEIFSTWRPDSVVSRINRGLAVELPEEYSRVLRLASDVHQRSDGAFDPEVGEVVDQLGFASAHSGRWDFSGVAKGFAVDEIGRLLESRGIDTYLFEIGGELLGRGARGWRVGLESADPGSVGKVRRAIVLRDGAVATSGTYRLSRGDGDNHLVDPRTGKPIAHDLVSVSVVAESCAEADAWATALIVLGQAAGIEVAERERLRAVFVRRSADGAFEEIESAAWKEQEATSSSPPAL